MPPRTTSASDAWLEGIPAERRAAVTAVRNVIRAHLPRGYEEVVARGTLVWQVPLSRYPDTYNGHPLWYAAIGVHKSYLSLYLMSAYGDPGLKARLVAGFKAAGKKLDMGKSCIHFSRAEDLPLETIGEIVAALPVDRWVAIAEAARRR